MYHGHEPFQLKMCGECLEFSHKCPHPHTRGKSGGRGGGFEPYHPPFAASCIGAAMYGKTEVVPTLNTASKPFLSSVWRRLESGKTRAHCQGNVSPSGWSRTYTMMNTDDVTDPRARRLCKLHQQIFSWWQTGHRERKARCACGRFGAPYLRGIQRLPEKNHLWSQQTPALQEEILALAR